MSPRGPSGASKSQKAAFSKTLKNHLFLKVFGSRGLPREPQEAQEGSQEAPKELQNPKKKGSKIGSKNDTILDQFWSNFGNQNGNQEKNKKHIFGTPFPRISGVQITARQELYERGEKPTVTGIILSKRKGGI